MRTPYVMAIPSAMAGYFLGSFLLKHIVGWNFVCSSFSREFHVAANSSSGLSLYWASGLFAISSPLPHSDLAISHPIGSGMRARCSLNIISSVRDSFSASLMCSSLISHRHAASIGHLYCGPGFMFGG